MPIDIGGTENFGGGAYQVPIDKDKGNDVFVAIEDFMRRMAVHTHTGQNASEISLNFTKEIDTLVVGQNIVWNYTTEGDFEAAISLPAVVGHNHERRFYRVITGVSTEIFPDQEYFDATTYKITANEATDLRIVYF